MELTSDLTAIQSIIRECERQAGELRIIEHKGGNELCIQLVIEKIKQFLISKNYITDQINVNAVNADQLKSIVLFLILNTQLNQDERLANITEYAHLINIMPKLSKFLLINIVIEINLIEIYTKATFVLPLEIIPELFETANETFIGAEGSKTLKNANAIVKCLIGRVNISDIQNNQVFDIVRKLNNIIGQLLMNLTVHPSISMPNASEIESHLHIGYVLYNLCEMLLQVDETKAACVQIIKGLVLTSSMVIKHITVNIYCTWAEVDEDELPLQYAIGTRAYQVIEKYAKFEPAAELIPILTFVAKKPKSLSEIISHASLQTIVKKINEEDANQRRWFAALLKRQTDIFAHDYSKECLVKWHSLASLDDCIQILKLPLELSAENTENARKLAVRCVSHLSVQNVSILIARFFWVYEPWKAYTNTNCQQQLTVLLNKINQQGEHSGIIKDIQLLLLENPQELLESLFRECIKNKIYVDWLEGAFKALEHVMNLNNVPLEILAKIVGNWEFAKDCDIASIIALFNMLIRTQCTDVNKLYLHALRGFIFSKETSEKVEQTNYYLQIVKEINLLSLNETNKEELVLELFKCLEGHRVKYTEFSKDKLNICISSIAILTGLKSSFDDFITDETIAKMELRKINKYYLLTNHQTSFLNYLIPSCTEMAYGLMISKLIKIFSRCVPQEWLWITEELAVNLGTQKATEALTDCLILICEVTQTQNIQNATVFMALQFYLGNYGICIQKMREKDSSVHFVTFTVRHICRLIKMLPADIKQQEGINLITLLPADEVMTTLSKDKQFVALVADIGDAKLSQIIAKKMIV